MQLLKKILYWLVGLALIMAVAMKASIRQNRTNVAAEVHGRHTRIFLTCRRVRDVQKTHYYKTKIAHKFTFPWYSLPAIVAPPSSLVRAP